jgi:hypothetical protein
VFFVAYAFYRFFLDRSSALLNRPTSALIAMTIPAIKISRFCGRRFPTADIG